MLAHNRLKVGQNPNVDKVNNFIDARIQRLEWRLYSTGHQYKAKEYIKKLMLYYAIRDHLTQDNGVTQKELEKIIIDIGIITTHKVRQTGCFSSSKPARIKQYLSELAPIHSQFQQEFSVARQKLEDLNTLFNEVFRPVKDSFVLAVDLDETLYDNVFHQINLASQHRSLLELATELGGHIFFVTFRIFSDELHDGDVRNATMNIIRHSLPKAYLDAHLLKADEISKLFQDFLAGLQEHQEVFQAEDKQRQEREAKHTKEEEILAAEQSKAAGAQSPLHQLYMFKECGFYTHRENKRLILHFLSTLTPSKRKSAVALLDDVVPEEFHLPTGKLQDGDKNVDQADDFTIIQAPTYDEVGRHKSGLTGMDYTKAFVRFVYCQVKPTYPRPEPHPELDLGDMVVHGLQHNK